jgi:hypothetical protein
VFELDKSRNTFVEEQRKLLRELAPEDIGYVSKKGEEAGFGELEKNKQQLARYLDEVLDLMTSDEPLANLALEDSGRQAIMRATATMQSWRSNAKNYASQQTDQNYHNKRQALLQEGAGATDKAFRELAPFEVALRIQRLAAGGDIGDKRRELDRAVREAKEAATTFQDLQEKARDQIAGLTKDQAAKRFRDLANGHRRSERIWLALFTAVCVTLASFVWITASTSHFPETEPVAPTVIGNAQPPNGQQLPQAASASDRGENGQQLARVVDDSWRRLLLLSTLALGVRIVLARYRDERSLRILYDHRATVLGQYELFDAAIGDDGSAKNQFRLEMARIVFSDPATGTDARGGGGDININPAISAIEKLGKPT